MNRWIARFSVAAFVLALLLTVTSIGGCNTVKGAGEDISSLGEGVSEAAEETNPDNN